MLTEKLKGLRMSAHISQKELAKKLNLDYKRYNHYETGRSEPDNKTLIMIADYFGVSTDYLLGREEKKPAPTDGDGLSETAKQIMDCVRQMSSQEQEAFLAWLQASQGRG